MAPRISFLKYTNLLRPFNIYSLCSGENSNCSVATESLWGPPRATHAHQVSDAIQPSHPLSAPSPPAPNPSQHQGLLQ